jgi:hypothetical protein
MAAIVGTYGLVKWYTLAYQVTMTSTADTQTIVDLLTTSGLAALAAQTPVNPLKTFLQGTYTSAAAADTAFRAIGGEISIRQIGGTACPAMPVVDWVNANPVVNLGFTVAGGASNEVFEVVIRVPHTAIY